MYGAGGGGGGPGAGPPPHNTNNNNGYPGGGAFGGGAFGAGPTTTTATAQTPPPPPQWPVSYSQGQRTRPASPVKRAQGQLRRWWDAALSGGGKRRRRAAAAAPPPPDKTPRDDDDDDDWLSRLCFFAIAVAYKTPWTAVSSLLGQLAELHGPRVLLGLNLAYFLPSIPVLLAHAAAAGGGAGGSIGGGGINNHTPSFYASFEARAGVPTSAALRLFFGLGGLAAVSALLMPALCAASGARAAALLLLATAGLGAMYGVAFGASYSLAARRCAPRGATVALSTGFVACGAVVLAADVGIKRGAPAYTREGLSALFGGVVAGTCLAGALASAVLLRRHWDELEADDGGGGGGGGEQEAAAAVPPSSSSSWRQRLRVLSSSPAAAAAAARSAVRVTLLLPPRGGGRGNRPTTTMGVPRGADAAGPSSSPSAFGVSSPSHGAAMMRHRALGAESMALMTGARRAGGAGGSSGGGFLAATAADASALPLVSAAAAADYSGGEKLGRQQPFLRRLAAALTPPPVDPSLAATARRAAPAALALALSVGTSMLAFPFFSFSNSGGALGRSLPQALFYARLAGDVGGRVLTPRLGISGPRSLAGWALAKTLLLPLLLAALLRPWLAGGDYGLCAAVFGYWALSGAINTSAYVVAPQLVPSHKRAQAGGLMALVFQFSCFAGLMGAAVLQLFVPDDGGGGSGSGLH